MKNFSFYLILFFNIIIPELYSQPQDTSLPGPSPCLSDPYFTGDGHDTKNRGGEKNIPYCSVNAGIDITMCLADVKKYGVKLTGSFTDCALCTRWLNGPVNFSFNITNSLQSYPPSVGPYHVSMAMPVDPNSLLPGDYEFTFFARCCGQNPDPGSNYSYDYVTLHILPDPDFNLIILNQYNVDHGIYYVCRDLNVNALWNFPNGEFIGEWSIDPADDWNFQYEINEAGHSIYVNAKSNKDICDKTVKICYTLKTKDGLCSTTKCIKVKFCGTEENPPVNGGAITECGAPLCGTTAQIGADQFPFPGCGVVPQFFTTFNPNSPNEPIISVNMLNGIFTGVTITNLLPTNGVPYKFTYKVKLIPNFYNHCPCDPASFSVSYTLDVNNNDMGNYSIGSDECRVFCNTTPSTIPVKVNTPIPNNANVIWSLNNFFGNPIPSVSPNNIPSTNVINVPEQTHFIAGAVVSTANCKKCKEIIVYSEDKLSVTGPNYISCDAGHQYIKFKDFFTSLYLNASGDLLYEDLNQIVHHSIKVLEQPGSGCIPWTQANYTSSLGFYTSCTGCYKFEIKSVVQNGGCVFNPAGNNNCTTTATLEICIGPGTSPVNAGTDFQRCAADPNITLNGNVPQGGGTYNISWSLVAINGLPPGTNNVVINPNNISMPNVSGLEGGNIYTFQYKICSNNGSCCAIDEVNIEALKCDDCPDYVIKCLNCDGDPCSYIGNTEPRVFCLYDMSGIQVTFPSCLKWLGSGNQSAIEGCFKYFMQPGTNTISVDVYDAYAVGGADCENGTYRCTEFLNINCFNKTDQRIDRKNNSENNESFINPGIFPNPTNSSFTISNPNNYDIQVEISDTREHGITKFQIKANSSFTYNSHLTAGVYYIKFSSNYQVYSNIQKVIIF